MKETPTRNKMAASSKKTITAVSPSDSGKEVAVSLPKEDLLFSVLYAKTAVQKSRQKGTTVGGDSRHAGTKTRRLVLASLHLPGSRF
jgi:hypothetical protein